MIDVNNLTQQDRKFLKIMKARGIPPKEAFARLEAVKPKPVSLPVEAPVENAIPQETPSIQGSNAKEPNVKEPNVKDPKEKSFFGRLTENIEDRFNKGVENTMQADNLLKEGKPFLSAMKTAQGGIQAVASPITGAVETAFEPITKGATGLFSSLLERGLKSKLGDEKGKIAFENMKKNFSEDITKLEDKYNQLPDNYKIPLGLIGTTAGTFTDLEGASGLKSLSEGIAKQSLKLPQKAIEKGVNLKNIAKDVVKDTKGNLSKIGKNIKDINMPLKETANDTFKYGLKQVLGFEENTLKELADKPKFIRKAIEDGNFTRQNIKNEVGEALDKMGDKLNDSISKTKGLDKEYFTPDKDELIRVVKERTKVPIAVENGKITLTGQGDSKLLLSDVKKINKILKDTNINFDKKMSGKEWTNFRRRLDGVIDWTTVEGKRVNDVLKQIRTNINDQAHRNINKLKIADKSIADDVGIIKTLKSEYFRRDPQTRKWVLKDTASSKLANLWKNGKEDTLKRLDKIIPGISNNIRTLAAIEDIYHVGGKSVGNYTKALVPAMLGFGSGAGFTGGLLGFVTGLYITNPKNAVKFLTSKLGNKVLKSAYGKKALKGFAKSRAGIKPTKEEAIAIMKMVGDIKLLPEGNLPKGD